MNAWQSGVLTAAATVYVAVSLVTLALYAKDKVAAKTRNRRVSERALLWMGFLGGWPGGVIAMWLFRHKRRKGDFLVRFWFGALLNVVWTLGLLKGILST